METKKYHVYFKGEILPGFELSRVKQNLTNLYKNNPGLVQTLFSGKTLTIKKDTDYSTALNYFRAFEKAGARCHLAVVKESAQKAGVPASTTPKSADKPAPTLKKDGNKPGEVLKKVPYETLFRRPQPLGPTKIESQGLGSVETPLKMAKGGTVIREESRPGETLPPGQGQADLQIGDVILDLYEVTALLGEGGMGKVYKVHHRGWNMDLAVKTPLENMIVDEIGKENFILEAETWVNLGLHPYVVSCYYVRTFKDIPRVFAEFVDGGSLKDLIDSRQLYRGGTQKSLERILNTAIQFAWGLHYAHDQGLVHQDVKPANAMMTKDGTLKVTDFGLAKAQAISAGRAAPSPGKSILVSAGGMTEAYCSPEQSQWKPLSRKTDIWSWAVSVLEMFTGGVTWMSGTIAAEALESYRQQGRNDPAVPHIPASLFDLLKHCFNREPEMRPQTMLEVANRLKEIYKEVTGNVYPRTEPGISKDTADNLNNRAVSLVDLDQEEEAIQRWNKALELQPHHPEATYNLGLIQWRSARITDTHLLTRMEEVRKSHGTSGTANYLLGLVHLERVDCESALNVLKETVDRDTDINREDLRAAITLARQEHPQSRKLLRVFEGHKDQVSTVAFSVDGRLALSGGWDNTIKLWELETGQCLRTFTGHTRSVNAAVLSTDARVVLSCSSDGTLRLWEIASGSCLRTITAHSGWIDTAALSHNARYALSGSEDKTIKLWDVNSGLCLRTLRGHLGAVTTIAWSLDGRFILSGSYESIPRLWELKTGQCIRTFTGHDESITSVAMSQDGKFGLSGSTDRTIKLWHLETGQCIRTFTGHQDKISSVSLTPDGQFALSGSEDYMVRLWEVKTGRCLHSFAGHVNKVIAVALSKDGKLALSGGGGYSEQWFQTQDTSMRLWQTAVQSTPNTAPLALSRIRTSETVLSTQAIYEQHINGAREAFNRQQFGEAAQHLRKARSQPGYERGPEAISLWSQLYRHLSHKKLKGVWEQLSIDSDKVRAVVIDHRCTRVLAGGSYDKTFKLWDLEKGVHLRTFAGHSGSVTSLALSADNRYILSGSEDNTLKLWDIESGECLKTFAGHDLRVSSVALTPDRRRALSGSLDKTLKLWDVKTGQCLKTFTGHGSWVNSVTLDANGVFALSCSGELTMDGTHDNTIKLWDIESGQCQRTFYGHEGFVFSISLDKAGHHILSASYDHTLKLWDVKTGQCLGTFKGHTDDVTAVSFNSDIGFAVSASSDKTIKLWDVASGRCLRTLAGHTGPVKALYLSRDNSYIASGSEDKTLKLWFLDWELEET